MRILHAYKIYRPDIEGGIPAVIASLAASSEDNVTHTILCARRRGMARRLVVNGIPVEAVSSLGNLASTPLAPAYIPTLVLRMRDADVLVHHAPLPLNDAAILLGLPDRVGLIVYWHAEIARYAMLKRLVSPLIRRVLARADRIVVSGQPMIDQSPFLRPHAQKCIVIPYGMDLDDWSNLTPDEAGAAERMRRDKPRHIVALGRLVGYKGYDVLIRAMREVNGQVTIAGEGPLLDGLRQLAAEIGVADRVRFVGRLSRDEIRLLFHSADVFAFPSVTDAEAFGIVQVEAMAAGLPIVNTNLSTTVPLVARHDCEALTVAPGDQHALADALNRIMDNPALAQRLGQAGRTRAIANFSQRVFCERMASVYREVRQHRGKT